MEKGITAAQIRYIHALMSAKGLMPYKADIIYSMTNGRAASSREMTAGEAGMLIDRLTGENDRKERGALIKRIWFYGFKTGIIYGDTPEDMKINAAKLNIFCMQRGTVKKPINLQSTEELKKTKRQFEAIYGKCLDNANKKKMLRLLGESLDKAAKEEDYSECIEIRDRMYSLKHKKTKRHEERIF